MKQILGPIVETTSHIPLGQAVHLKENQFLVIAAVQKVEVLMAKS
jgi:hypothetical protein